MATAAESRNSGNASSRSDYYAKPLPHFQIVLLHQIESSIESQNYLTEIAKRVSLFLEKEYSIPHIASSLERLVDKKFCKAYTREEEIRGRAKRFYEITEEGKIALAESSKAIHEQLTKMDIFSNSKGLAFG